MIARLIDAEGVTWDEFAIERHMPVIRLMVGPRLSARFHLNDEAPFDPAFRTAEFQYAGRDGGGTLIYRLRSHVL